jgi:plasmid stability protein
MATIQVRDLPDDVAEVFRRRAEAAGRSLQSYMRDELIAMARRRNKAEVMEIMAETLAADPGPGLSAETVAEALGELRGE